MQRLLDDWSMSGAELGLGGALLPCPREESVGLARKKQQFCFQLATAGASGSLQTRAGALLRSQFIRRARARLVSVPLVYSAQTNLLRESPSFSSGVTVLSWRGAH